MAITDTNVSAVLFQAVEGSGAMNVVKPATQSADDGKAAETPAPKTDAAPNITPLLRPAATKKQPAPEKPLLSPQQREKLNTGIRQTAAALARAIQALRRLSERLSDGIQTLIPRLVPGEQNTGQKGIPKVGLVFLAAAIPLLTLTVGMLVYYQVGQPAIFDSYYQKALDAVEKTKTEKDPTSLRTHWDTALYWIRFAEDKYLIPERAAEAHDLHQRAQKSLDRLNRVTRVQYRPAFNPPLRRLNVTRMVATDVDLYLLYHDNNTSGIIHGTLNGQSYSSDPGFESCKPGTYDGVQVGKLLDMIALPRSNASGASLIAIDEAGNLLYCASEEKPKAVSLQKPSQNLQSITSIAYDANSLYLLDSLGHAVWVYFGTVNIQFPNKPFFFFESQVPNDIENMVDMAVNGDDLYLLHKNGQLTTCTLSRIEAAPTLCTDPATLVDTRPGYEGGDELAVAIFEQIAFTSPPDPAVALLQPHTQSIYRFSARALELQHEIAPLPRDDPNTLPAGDVTAMAFSPNKAVFIFLNGQTYYTVNVP
jgi:hypothetical protein